MTRHSAWESNSVSVASLAIKPAKTKRRIFKKVRGRIDEYHLGKITGKSLEQSLQSYPGVLSHANTYKLSERLKNKIWF